MDNAVRKAEAATKVIRPSEWILPVITVLIAYQNLQLSREKLELEKSKTKKEV